MSDKIEYTKVEIREKEREIFFTVNHKHKYKIPSKMFPVSNKKQMAVFTTENTVPFQDEQFFKFLDMIDLPMGMCYTNSEYIKQIGEQLGFKIHYFSGWVFKMGDMPKHHAWVVIEHEGGLSIVDSLKETLFIEASKQIKIDYDEENWRKKTALAVKEAERKFPHNHEQIIIGQVLGNFFYVGSPDNIDNSRKIFTDLIKQFPQHPAYQGDGDNMEGRSKLQEEMARLGIK